VKVVKRNDEVVDQEKLMTAVTGRFTLCENGEKTEIDGNNEQSE
jgi:hypothetical protein